jgi:hypothetical protein
MKKSRHNNGYNIAVSSDIKAENRSAAVDIGARQAGLRTQTETPSWRSWKGKHNGKN